MDWNTYLLSLLIELIGVGIAAYLGYLLGIKQEKRMRHEEEKERKRITLQSLLEEVNSHKSIIESNITHLEPHENDDSVYLPLPLMFREELLISSYDSAFYSDRFSLISYSTQTQISKYYLDVKRLINYFYHFEKMREKGFFLSIIKDEDGESALLLEPLKRELLDVIEDIYNIQRILRESVIKIITLLEQELTM